MAASLSPIQRQEDFMEEFLECSICAEPYDDDQHKAKCLPCLHTYCKSCLEKHTSGKSKFHCPNCRCLVVLAEGNVDKLQNNFIIENLKDYRDIFNLSSVTCGSCEDSRNVAESFCHDCGCFLCHECINAHKRLGPLRMHKLSTLEALQKQKCNPVSQCNQKCERHPKQELNFYCRERKCKIPVCSSCGLTDHKNHDLVDLTVAINEVMVILQSLSTHVCCKNQDEVETELNKIEATKKTLMDNYEMKLNHMLKSKETLINLIESQHTIAKSHLQSLYDTEMEHLSGAMESLDSLAAQMTSACEFANQACDTSNPIHLLTSQVHIKERLLELNNKEVPSTVMDKVHLIFTQHHHSAMSEIQGLVKHLFDNDWEKNLSHCQDDGNYVTSESEVRSKSVKISCKVKKSNSSVGGKLKKVKMSLIKSSSKTPPLSIPLVKVPTNGSSESLLSSGKGGGTLSSTSSERSLCSTTSELKEGTTQCSTATEPKEGTTQCSTATEPKVASILRSTSTESKKGSSPHSISSDHSVDPRQCTIEFQFNPNLMSRVNAIIHTVNICGRPMTTGGLKIEVRREKQDGTSSLLKVQDNGNGTYMFGYKKGSHSVPIAHIHVTINGVPIKGSPFNPYRSKQK